MKNPKINFLLIDDNEPMTEAITDLISLSFDSEFDVSFNGEDGLDKANSKKYQFIITDYLMPGLLGDSFIETIRTSGGVNATTPILFLTGMQPDLTIQSSSWENVFFLRKPIDDKKLSYMIKCCLQINQAG
jgi:DNA-binding response OmpR family regulator